MKQLQFGVIALLIIFLSGTLIAAEHGGNKSMGMGPGCQYCGMNLQKFAHTAMDITYEDGSTTHVCSIHCAAIDLALNIDKAPAKMMVGDFKSKEKIEAEKANWVIDNKNPGVMTSRAKWAFRDKSEAEAYIAQKNGRLISFENAMKAAYMDMYEDTLMIRKKRKMKKHGLKMSHK